MSETYNTLRNNAFTFNLLRLPDTVFRIVSIDVPDVSNQPSEIPTRHGMLEEPGSVLLFSELTLRFIVDENLKNYEELFNWLTQQKFASEYVPTSKEQFLVSDGTLTTLNNSSVANRTFSFKNMFPISLSGFQFATTSGNSEPIECTVSFKFDYFDLK